MALNNPHIQIVRKDTTGNPSQYFIYVTTYFDRSDYQADGYDEVDEPVDGVLSVTVNVCKSGVALKLCKPVVHQVDITSIGLEGVTDVNVIINEDNTALGSRSVPHQDESETIVRPIPDEWMSFSR